MMRPEPDDASLTADEMQKVDRACDAFERAWQAGQRPSIEQLMADSPVRVRQVLLIELLEIDVAYRRNNGERPTLAEYHSRFPDQLGAVRVYEGELGGALRGRSPRARPPLHSTEAHVHVPEPVPADAAPANSPTLPGYEIVEELGRGGMGIVYKAKQVSAHRFVALKMIRDSFLAGPEQRLRFRIEAEAAARCRHPNLVRIYEVGEHAGLPYFSMELGEGGSLDRKLLGGPLPEHEAASLVQTLAAAVQYAHDKQIVHRDLKPANVVLTADGEPLITDFGLAKLLDSDTVVTRSEAVLGTASYMAPEQAAGQARHVGPPADIYSLGAILYELLTGRPPFRGANFDATVQQVLHDDPTPPTQLRPEIAPAVENICLKCLEKEPAQRYSSARELAVDLGRFLAGESVAAAPSSEWERQVRWARQAGFEIEEVLTYGIHDSVYRARQVHLNRVVALKIVTAAASTDPAVLARRRKEAEVVAQLDHPNIVRIHNSGELRGRTYLAFEYVDGGSLIEHSDQPMPPRQAAQVVQKLAEAIHYAHQRGILHCALKPSNVLLAADGVPKITNFSLSIRLEQPASERPLAFRQLPDYQAPELVDGRTDEIGPATDVYGLGAILYKLLTGDPPFLADTVADTAAQVRSQPAPAPGSVCSDVPAALDAICLSCLAKAPQQRFSSAGELARELSGFLSGESPRGKASSPVPGYEVLRVLGEGSMSIVYEARQATTQRLVALKMMRKEFYYGQSLRELLQEGAVKVSRLRHPNIVELYDFGEVLGQPYLVMELLPGGSLERRRAMAVREALDEHQGQVFRQADNRRAGQVAIPEAVALVRTLAGTLEAVHRQSIVHGNLKPSKVLFAADGTPKVTGFIIARQEREPDTNLTITGPAIMGTPRYMAPEQLAGNTQAVGPATDVHALGLLLYELLTGWLPYRAVTLWEMMAQVLHEPPQRPSELRADLPSDLEAVCLRCLAKEPKQRYPTAGALAEALDALLAGGEPPTPRHGVWTRLAGWLKGQPRKEK
jgi:serine/threonine protein kinase